MNTPLFVPEQTLVDWYLNPSITKSTKRPTESFDHPVETLQESINLTMRFVTAAQPMFGQGFRNKGVRPVMRVTKKKKKGKTTLFWSLYEVREENTVETDETDTGVRTEIIIRYYGFDAGRRLMVETIRSHKREDAYTNGYSWPDEQDIPPNHLRKLLNKLLDFRRDLSS